MKHELHKLLQSMFVKKLFVISLLPLIYLSSCSNPTMLLGTETTSVTNTELQEPKVTHPPNTEREIAPNSTYFPVIAYKSRQRVVGRARGYLTTPQELREISLQAARGVQPYKDAVAAVIQYAGEPTQWPAALATLDGLQTCAEDRMPPYLHQGSSLIYAKALTYHLTNNQNYAAEVGKHLLDLTDTYGYGGEEYSGGNQCILNLSWYLPGWIMAADLIEDYTGWTRADKQLFQKWLADEVYKKTAWSSRSRKNNWGSAGSATSAMIADYLWDSPFLLQGATPSQAYAEHNRNQIERMNTTWQGDSRCSIWGIQAYGGIPDELERGSSGCNARWLLEKDGSWTYSMTFLQSIVLHAEMLWRRGDASIYENKMADGSGSLLQAIHFIIDNPIDPGKSLPWRDSHKQTLEVTYRYYRDTPSALQLGIGQAERYISMESNQTLHFGTLTHGFAVGENPAPPPIVPPP